MEITALVTVAAVLEYAVFSLLVGLARGRTGVEAPRISGNPEFERYFRVQQNTLERLVIFLPSLWLFSHYVSVLVGGILGGVFVLGRVLYAAGYVSAPNRRFLGFGLGELANMSLMLGSVYGVVRALLV